jgi:TolB protein
MKTKMSSMRGAWYFLLALALSLSLACVTKIPKGQRTDGALHVNIALNGSLQNPAWSPDSNLLLFTRFRNGYNIEPADLLVFDTGSNARRTLVSEGSGNINLPGSSWNSPTSKITFSSSREPHDEIYLIDDHGSPGAEVQITSRATMVAYEPSLSPDGQWVVFESHKLDVEDNGILVKYRVDGTSQYQNLTVSSDDCRQPNWSPAGSKIVYQKFAGGQWDIWMMNIDGTNHQKITSGAGDKTDASFSPDGKWIVYSSDESGLGFANLFVTPISGGNSIRVTHYAGYDGAPSWSPNGKKIAFESYPGDPDGSTGTSLWIIDIPALPEIAVFQSEGLYDGMMLESTETSNKGGTLNTTAPTFQLGDDDFDRQYRAILSFNTEALPDNAVITKLALKINKQGSGGSNPFITHGGLNVDICKPYFGTTDGLVIGDFQAAVSKAAVGTFGTTPVNNWYSAIIGSAGYPYINLTGTTQFRLYFTKDDNDDMGADFMKFLSGNYGTASSRPTLIIEHYVP